MKSDHARIHRTRFLTVTIQTLTILVGWLAIAQAEDPKPGVDPQAILTAARKTCESLRSGHFTMTGVLNFPVEVDDPAARKANWFSSGKSAKDASVKRQLEYWFDVDKDLWRIDLAPEVANPGDWGPGPVPLLEYGFQFSATPERIAVSDFHTLKYAAPGEHDKELTRGLITFNAQSLANISFGLLKEGRYISSPMKSIAPEQIFNGPKSELHVVKSVSESRIVLRLTPTEPGPSWSHLRIERVFLRQPMILPTRRTVWEIPLWGSKRKVAETDVEWREVNGIHVPVRIKVRDTQYIGGQYRARTGEFKLEWTSVNEPVNPDDFDLVKQAEEDRILKVIDLDNVKSKRP